jgi:uncharacterized peroxidase-related enzyme
MSRLHTQEISAASGPVVPLFAAIQRTVGKVPNTYADIGANSAVALEAALNLDAALAKSTLSAKQREVIKLAVSEMAGCDYCLAAHSLMSKKIGLGRETILGARHGQPTGDALLDALVNFVRALVNSRGTVATEVVDAVKAAGFSDAQIVDTLLTITSITFTNLFNRVNDTTLDFPAAE